MPSIAPFLKARQAHNLRRDKSRVTRHEKAITMAARIIAGETFPNWKLAEDRSTITTGTRVYSLAKYQTEIDTKVEVILNARAKALKEKEDRAKANEAAAVALAEKEALEDAAKDIPPVDSATV